MTFLDVEAEHAEVDFTAAARVRRGLGLATAVRAASPRFNPSDVVLERMPALPSPTSAHRLRTLGGIEAVRGEAVAALDEPYARKG